MGSLCHICKLQREEQNCWAVFLFPSASIPKEDAQLQGTNTDTGAFDSSLFFFPFKTLQDGFTFCFGKLSGIRVGEGE